MAKQIQQQQEIQDSRQQEITKDQSTLMNPRQLDTEIQKHILNINPLQMAFYYVFCGWREENYPGKKKAYNKEKPIIKTHVVIDIFARCMNEAGANELYYQMMPLIAPAAATSHAKPMEIYNFYNGHLMTIESLLNDSYSIPTYLCRYKYKTGYCRFSTPNPSLREDHQKRYKHDKFVEIINPYELNVMRLPNVITFLATLALITSKAKEGFTLRELAESFMTSQIIKSGGLSDVNLQQTGIVRKFIGR